MKRKKTRSAAPVRRSKAPRRRRNAAAYPSSWDVVEADPAETDFSWMDDAEYKQYLRDTPGMEHAWREARFLSGRHREPRVRKTTCSAARRWRVIAGPFRTRRAAARHARAMRDKGALRAKPKEVSLGVVEQPRAKGRKTSDYLVCTAPSLKAQRAAPAKASTPKRSTPAKASTPKRRKNPALITVRNPRRTPARAAKPVAYRELLKAKRITPAQIDALARQDAQFRQALARWRRFHGERYPASFSEEEIDVASAGFAYAVALGDTVASEYRPTGHSKRANGPPYRHAFRRNGKTITATDPAGKGLFHIRRKGGRLRVTERGIID